MKKNIITNKTNSKKLKRNFIFSLIALILLAISILTVTYCWIEGSSSLKVVTPDNSSLHIFSTNKAVSMDPSQTNTAFLPLNSYIDNSDSLFLAPATSADGREIKIKDGDTFRSSNTNDIGKNYIDFEIQVSVSDEMKFFFTDSSFITVDDSTDNPICLSVTVSDKDYSNPTTTVFKASEIQNGNVCVLSENTTKILRFRIWNESTSGNVSNFYGKTVNFNLELNSKSNYTTLTFVDRTNDSSSLYLTSEKKMYAVNTATGDKYVLSSIGNNTYASGRTVSISALQHLEFQCYSSDGSTLLARWQPSSPIEDGTYTAYGDIFSSTNFGYGAWDDVVRIDVNDFTVNSDICNTNNKTLTNGIDTLYYTMYYNSASQTLTTFVPKRSFDKAYNTSGLIYINGRNSSGVSEIFSMADITEYNDISSLTDVTYSIFGDTGIKGAEYNDSLYLGRWCNSADTITIQDRTGGNLVLNAGDNFKVSFDNTNYYYAKYNSLEKTWTVKVPSDIMLPLSFNATNGANNYVFDGSNRTKTNENYLYTITSASPSEGTWSYTSPVTVHFINNEDTQPSVIDMYLYDTVNTTAYKMTKNSTTNEWTVGVPENVKNIEFYRADKKYALDINNQITGSATAAGYYNKWSAGNKYLNTVYTATGFDLSKYEGSWTDLWKLYGGTLLADLVNSSTSGVYTYDYNSTGGESKTFKIYNSNSEALYGNATTINDTTTSPVTFDTASGLCTLTCTNAGKYTFTVNITGENPTLTVSYISTDKDIYLKNSAHWSSPFLYAWKDANHNAAWPGVAMEKVSSEVYKLKVSSQFESIIFSNNKSSQTGNLSVPTSNNVMYDNKTNKWITLDTNDYIYLKPNSNWTQDGARFAIYMWNDEESDPIWISMESVGSSGYYRAVLPDSPSRTKINFCRMNGATTENNWDNKWNQTDNLTLNYPAQNCYTVARNTWDKGGGSWSYYNP